LNATAQEGRCLGLIGGLGPAATVHYYRELVAAHEKAARIPRLLIAHADVHRVYTAVTAKDFNGLARYLAGFVTQLKAGGAEITAIVAATPHICADRLVALSPLPLVNMLTVVGAAVRARGLKRVALLGTRFTIETRMFGCLDDIEVVMPQADEIESIHRIYTDFVAGRGSDAQTEEMRKLAQTFVARDGAQAVLIAGTDLSMIFTEATAGFPLIDCAAVHIDAIVRRLFG
jgi:aspartate racemase